MDTNSSNLNATLYSNDLFEEWSERDQLLPAEEYLLSKYLTDPTQNVLEAGTGGGSISFYIENMGFKQITAFDFVPRMVEHAKSLAQKRNSCIHFKIGDASHLPKYDNESFSYLIYLQQVLCFIDQKELFSQGLKEAYRIAKTDGIIIFSFLDFDSRAYNSTLSTTLTTLRKLRKEKTGSQYLPWLRIGNKFNWKLLGKNQAVSYWVKKEDILAQLKAIGFKVLEAKNTNQINHETSDRKGMLYIVCQK